MCGQSFVYVSMGAEAIGSVTEYVFRLRRLGSYARKDVGSEFEYAVHLGYGYAVGWVVWVGFVWFVYEFGGACASLLWCVAVFVNHLE
jgi:hypothetical protein